MTTITITLPMPDKYLNPNSRYSERFRRQIRAGHRAWAVVEARSELVRRNHFDGPLFPPGTRLVVTAACTPPRFGRRWDDDNLRAALKGYLDGMEQAGVYADDRLVDIDRVLWSKPEGPGQVVLTVREDTRDRAAAIEDAARTIIEDYLAHSGFDRLPYHRAWRGVDGTLDPPHVVWTPHSTVVPGKLLAALADALGYARGEDE
jgi:hypothetical protein